MDNIDLSDSLLYEESFGFKFRSDVRRMCVVLAAIAIAIVIALTVITRSFENICVVGRSMQNTLHDGDTVIIELTQDVERGDIIVLDVSDYPDEFSGKLIVKRLIAMEGDELYCEDGVIYIKYSASDNFIALEEDYTSSITPSFSRTKVGKGEIFFLGDNRANSNDSTEVGCLPISVVYGKVSSFALAIKGFTTFVGDFLK